MKRLLSWFGRIRLPRIEVTRPRPTVLFLDTWGTIVIALCCVVLYKHGDVLPIVGAWLGVLIVRMLDILKDEPDDVPSFKTNIAFIAVLAGGMLVFFVDLAAAKYAKTLIPLLTTFTTAYAVVPGKIVNNENAMAAAIKAGNENGAGGCRYPKEAA